MPFFLKDPVHFGYPNVPRGIPKGPGDTMKVWRLFWGSKGCTKRLFLVGFDTLLDGILRATARIDGTVNVTPIVWWPINGSKGNMDWQARLQCFYGLPEDLNATIKLQGYLANVKCMKYYQFYKVTWMSSHSNSIGYWWKSYTEKLLKAWWKCWFIFIFEGFP